MMLDVTKLWEMAWPWMLLLGAALLSLLSAGLPERHRVRATAIVAAAGFLLSAQGFLHQWASMAPQRVDFLVVDRLSNYLGALVSLVGFVVTVISYPYWKSQSEHIPEYFSLLLFSAFGMITMVMTTQLLTFVLGLEVMSLSLYALVGMRRFDPRS